MSDRSLTPSSTPMWKSLDELAGPIAPQGEFAAGVTEPPQFESSVSRRGFMALLSASMALTAAACRRPMQTLVPTVKSQQTATPGLPMDYSTVWSLGNVVEGALVRSREGRPIKVRGNTLHPSNLGSASAAMQASILSLYDPDRMRRATVKTNGRRNGTTYEAAAARIAEAIVEARTAGKKAVVLIDNHASPSYSALQASIAVAEPTVSFVTMPSIYADNAAIANVAMTGIDGEFVPDLTNAKVILSVDADILGTDPLSGHHTTRFTKHRMPSVKNPTMSLLLVAEAAYSLTGANADERYRLHPSQLEAFLAVVERDVVGASAIGGELASAADARTTTHAKAAAAALKAVGAGEAVVLTGRHLSPRANAMALNITNALGSFGSGRIVDPALVLPNSGRKGPAIDALVADMQAGRVHVLIAAGVNPEYSASRTFRTAMASVPVRAAINVHDDETAVDSHVSIPAAHWLETWGDGVAYDGTLSVRQPLIAPLNDGIPGVEDVLMTIAKKVNAAFMAEVPTYYDFVKMQWLPKLGADAGKQAAAWNTVLQDGVLRPATAPVATASVNAAAATGLPAGSVRAGRTFVAMPSLSLYDGAQGNNGWLHECPDPVTKITWDNVALVSPKTAVDLGFAASTSPKDVVKANERVVVVHTEHGSVELPIWVQVGMADDVIATQLGYGHRAGGTVGVGVGSNAYVAAPAGNATGYVAVKNVEPVEGKRHPIATTQNHHTLTDGQGERQIAHRMSLADLASGHVNDLNAHYLDEGKDKSGRYTVPLSITSSYEYKGHRWGMVIDMSGCTGCSSCIIACQSENNIPVVGKEQVRLGREMHWIRLDRYYTGADADNPETVVEPMLCQHCENAPCENVCPVAATTHSPEGLNEMTYNRCVGTRYCLNNCPYKVRRFNFLNYNEGQQSPMDLVFNPDVTKRFRGVMEKCTFCVQRLNEAKYHAKDAGRSRVLDGEAVTACQEACPAGAIIFGDLNDPKSKVSMARTSERGFHVLAELNVRPGVTYLAKVRNSKQRTDASKPKEHHS